MNMQHEKNPPHGPRQPQETGAENCVRRRPRIEDKQPYIRGEIIRHYAETGMPLVVRIHPSPPSLPTTGWRARFTPNPFRIGVNLTSRLLTERRVPHLP